MVKNLTANYTKFPMKIQKKSERERESASKRFAFCFYSFMKKKTFYSFSSGSLTTKLFINRAKP